MDEPGFCRAMSSKVEQVTGILTIGDYNQTIHQIVNKINWQKMI